LPEHIACLGTILQKHDSIRGSDKGGADLKNEDTVGVVAAIKDQGAGKEGRRTKMIDGRWQGFTTKVLARQVVTRCKGQPSSHGKGIIRINLCLLSNAIVKVRDTIIDPWWETSDCCSGGDSEIAVQNRSASIGNR